ncbi:MAG: hypothetical protein ACI956_000897 [Nonlabens sp.]|jgi:hypothetical protein
MKWISDIYAIGLVDIGNIRGIYAIGRVELWI